MGSKNSLEANTRSGKEMTGPKRKLVEKMPIPLKGYVLIEDPLFVIDLDEELKLVPKAEKDDFIAKKAVHIWRSIEVLAVGPDILFENEKLISAGLDELVIVAGTKLSTSIDMMNRGVIQMGQYLFVPKNNFHAIAG